MIILMGLPGSGKGTQGKMLADHHDKHLISMGEVVRMYVTGERRRRMMAGELLDDAEVIELLDGVLRSIHDREEVVLDGFPRTITQADWLYEQHQQKRCNLRYVINLAASKEAVKARLHARGRLDDKDEVIENRFREYERQTQPLLDWFTAHHIPIATIDAEQSIQAIHEEITDLLEQHPYVDAQQIAD